MTGIPELLIVGTGAVARALVSLGEAMGYHVRVAAGPRTPSVGEFDGADEVIVTPAAHDVEALRPGHNTFVVICDQDERFCHQVLRLLLPGPVPYLGMLVEKEKKGSLAERLVQDGFDPAWVARVRAPMGVDISAETPEEVALSVLAEIVQVRRTAPLSPRPR